MKKFFAVFAILCAVFLISCGSESENVYNYEAEDTDDSTKNDTDNAETSADEDAKADADKDTEKDTDKDAEDAGTHDTDADADADEDEYEDAEEGDTRNADCDPKPENAVWNDDGAGGKFVQTFDGGKWTPETHESVYGETQDVCVFKCAKHYTWNESDSSCKADSRKQKCTGKPKDHTFWNTVDEITQTWNGTDWEPSEFATFSETSSDKECFFICESGFLYDETTMSCIDPCDKCAVTEHATEGGTCKMTAVNEYYCECEKPYIWDSTNKKCKEMPECTPANVTPCRYNGLIWSAKAPSAMAWKDNNGEIAGKHCTDLDEGGFKDWRLPTLSELRMLIKNCDKTVIDGPCPARSEDLGTEGEEGFQPLCDEGSCNPKESCRCDEDLTGGYTPFGAGDADIDPKSFWTSTTRSDNTNAAWAVEFNDAYPAAPKKTEKRNVRCVR